MAYTLVRAEDVEAAPGPHPAASPYDKSIGEALGLTAFELYRVELPPEAETVLHDHLDDDNEDVYAIVSGSGWVLVDGASVPVTPGCFVAVEQASQRQVRAGADGLVLIALCAPARR